MKQYNHRYLKKKKNRTIKKTVSFIMFIIFILLSLRGVIYLINQYRSSIWDGETNLAIALRADGDYFVLLNNFQKKLYVISIPNGTVSNYQNSQEYTLDAIWKLGKINKNQKAIYMRTMQSLFGYPVHAIYENEKINLDNFDIKMSDIILGKTNLSIFDYLKIKSKQYQVIKRPLQSYVKPKLYRIKDESRLLFDEAQLDNELNNIFEDVNLSNYGYRVQIQVQNGEQNQNDSIARLITNIGWKVADVKYVDQEKKENQCILKVMNKTEELIRNLFLCRISYQSSSLYDLIIIAGEDFGNKFEEN